METKMIRQNTNQVWIWLIPHFLIIYLSSANNPDQYISTFPEIPVVNITDDGLLSEEWNYCQTVWSCSSVEDKQCYCDDLCSLFGDCCEDKFLRNTTEISFSQSAQTNKNTIYEGKSLASAQQLNKPLAKHSYNCTEENIYIVFRCPIEYANKYVRKNCEQPGVEDKLLHVPVSGVLPKTTSSVKFYNFYCAICHGLTDYNFWDLSCIDEIALMKTPDWNKTEANDSLEKLHNCFSAPKKETLRECIRVVDECPAKENNHNMSRCTQGSFQPIMDSSTKYKNKDCAFCHNVDATLLNCRSSRRVVPHIVHLVYAELYSMEFSIASLYDINLEIFSATKCDTIHDPFTGNCRPIYSSRSCNESNLKIHDPTIPCPNCKLIRLDENEYSRFGDSIRFQKSDLTINESLLYYIDDTPLHFIGDKPYICADHFSNLSEITHAFDKIEVYITIIGLILSILALLVTFSIYACFRSLRNVPGKMSMNLMASMFLASLLFISRNENPADVLCAVIGVCMHYAYLVSFFWMNALSFDAWNTFSKIAIGDRSNNCYNYYLIYCWITPLLIVSVSIFVQFTPFDIFPSWLSPKYDPPLCWISNKWSLLIFFAAPLFLLILCNVVFYALTICAINRTEKLSDCLLSKKNKGMFLIYLKLCFIMGITWMFALLHTLTEITIIRYISVFLNSFQGFWVGCSYLFSKQVCRLLKGKITFLRTTESNETESKHTSASYLTNVKSHS